MKDTIRIEVFGAQGSGKSRMIEEVVLPALRAHNFPFKFYDNESDGMSLKITHTSIVDLPLIEIFVSQT